jgi:predicted transcriptional regulator
MTAEESSDLDASIERGMEQAARGEGGSVDEVLRRLRTI